MTYDPNKLTPCCKLMAQKWDEIIAKVIYLHSGTGNIEQITITSNGTYDADGTTVTAYNPITVNVPVTIPKLSPIYENSFLSPVTSYPALANQLSDIATNNNITDQFVDIDFTAPLFAGIFNRVDGCIIIPSIYYGHEISSTELSTEAFYGVSSTCSLEMQGLDGKTIIQSDIPFSFGFSNNKLFPLSNLDPGIINFDNSLKTAIMDYYNNNTPYTMRFKTYEYDGVDLRFGSTMRVRIKQIGINIKMAFIGS